MKRLTLRRRSPDLRPAPVPHFLDDHLVRIGATQFHCSYPLVDVPEGCLAIAKGRELVEAYFALWSELRPQRVVELGMHQGGSAAMMCELGGLERIVTVELSTARVKALDDYVEKHGLHDVLRPYYGVDQADRKRLASIVDEEFSGAPFDLVIDDASHLYSESRASFETLFPRLRPGGLFLLEDWRWQHMMTARMTCAMEESDEFRAKLERAIVAEGRTAPETPMSRLAIELVIALAVSDHVVADVAIGPDWAAVRRGPAQLDPRNFRVDDIAPDQLSLLAPIR
jgi:predicted O-methyltransferase YrrM